MTTNDSKIREKTDRIAHILLEVSSEELICLDYLIAGTGLNQSDILEELKQIDLENPKNRSTLIAVGKNEHAEPRYVATDKETFLRLLPRLQTKEASIQRMSIRDLEAKTGYCVETHKNLTDQD